WHTALGSRRPERIPVLGSRISGLAGVYTLRVWRNDMREQQARLAQRADEASIWQQEYAVRLHDLEARALQLTDEAQVLRTSLSRMEERTARLADSIGVFELKLNRVIDDVAVAWRDLSRMGRYIAAGDEVKMQMQVGDASASVQTEQAGAVESIAQAQSRFAPSRPPA